jgi:hypothetical protein
MDIIFCPDKNKILTAILEQYETHHLRRILRNYVTDRYEEDATIDHIIEKLDEVREVWSEWDADNMRQQNEANTEPHADDIPGVNDIPEPEEPPLSDEDLNRMTEELRRNDVSARYQYQPVQPFEDEMEEEEPGFE